MSSGFYQTKGNAAECWFSGGSLWGLAGGGELVAADGDAKTVVSIPTIYT